jgi:hypothetical protein
VWRLLTTRSTIVTHKLCSMIWAVAAMLSAFGIAASVHAATAPPTCPAGLTFSRLDRACISVQVPTCGRPSAWNPARKGCFAVRHSACPSGYRPVPGAMCAPNTPAGAPPTAPPASSATVPRVCPSGYALSGNVCESNTSSPPICQSGYAYNARRGLCMQSQSASCPSGYQLDIVRGLCSTGPVQQ